MAARARSRMEGWNPVLRFGAVVARPLLQRECMYAGGSLLLIAVGAILYWAISLRVSGVDVHMVGFILMVVGMVSLLLSLLASATQRQRLP